MHEQKVGLLICKCRGEIANTIPIDELTEKFKDDPRIEPILVTNSLCDTIESNNIQKILKNHKPDGVVIAGCSPRYYESYFRVLMDKSGINAGKLQFANIREQIAWVFGRSKPKDFLLSKAELAINVAIDNLKYSHDFIASQIQIKKSVGIVGAGIGGIQTALTVARSGYSDIDIHLIEKSNFIGGPQLKYSKAFPRDECSACAISPLISELATFDNIHIHTNSEVTDCVGRVGDYDVKLEQKPTYITDKCIACGKCSAVCPITRKYDNNAEIHKAIHLPFAGTLPNKFVIDENNIDYCRNECDKPCIEACPVDCIDLEQGTTNKSLNVGSIVIATGAKASRPEEGEYGYGRNPNVLTLDQYEKLLTASHPLWKGGIKLLSDNTKVPESIAFILCVNRQTLGYCSKYCCLSTAAAVRQTADKLPNTKIYVFYQDLFADSKFGDEYLKNNEKLENVQWIRTIPKFVEETTSDFQLKTYLDVPVAGGRINLNIDMLVLATGMKSSEDNRFLRHIFGLDSSKEGFFAEFDLLFSPVSTNDIGKFLVGTASGPKTIPETTISALAVGSSIINLLSKKKISLPISVTNVNPDYCSGCGVCVKTCPYQANTLNTKDGIVEIDISRCRGCGNCVVACPSNARDLIEYPDRSIRNSIELLASSPTNGPSMLGFLCNGCGYPAADNVGLSGTTGELYSSNLSIIRVPCSGRVDPKHIIRALNKFDGVIIGACKLHSCHFSVGNFDAQKRVYLLQGTMKSSSIDPRRLRIEYFAPTDATKFCDTINTFESDLKSYIKEQKTVKEPIKEQVVHI